MTQGIVGGARWSVNSKAPFDIDHPPSIENALNTALDSGDWSAWTDYVQLGFTAGDLVSVKGQYQNPDSGNLDATIDTQRRWIRNSPVTSLGFDCDFVSAQVYTTSRDQLTELDKHLKLTAGGDIGPVKVELSAGIQSSLSNEARYPTKTTDTTTIHRKEGSIYSSWQLEQFIRLSLSDGSVRQGVIVIRSGVEDEVALPPLGDWVDNNEFNIQHPPLLSNYGYSIPSVVTPTHSASGPMNAWADAGEMTSQQFMICSLKPWQDTYHVGVELQRVQDVGLKAGFTSLMTWKRVAYYPAKDAKYDETYEVETESDITTTSKTASTIGASVGGTFFGVTATAEASLSTSGQFTEQLSHISDTTRTVHLEPETDYNCWQLEFDIGASTAITDGAYVLDAEKKLQQVGAVNEDDGDYFIVGIAPTNDSSFASNPFNNEIQNALQTGTLQAGIPLKIECLDGPGVLPNKQQLLNYLNICAQLFERQYSNLSAPGLVYYFVDKCPQSELGNKNWPSNVT